MLKRVLEFFDSNLNTLMYFIISYIPDLEQRWLSQLKWLAVFTSRVCFMTETTVLLDRRTVSKEKHLGRNSFFFLPQVKVNVFTLIVELSPQLLQSHLYFSWNSQRAKLCFSHWLMMHHKDHFTSQIPSNKLSICCPSLQL